MSSSDIRLELLTRNLRTLADSAASASASERSRLESAVRAARLNEQPLPTSRRNSNTRPRAAVVCWDLAHNPVGRGYVLYRLLESHYDVELVGPMWSRFGSQLWAPLRDSGLAVRSFSCDSIADFVPKAEALCAMQNYDLVVVCKPRLPSLYMGALLKRASNCPLVLDVDDHELSFFNRDDDASLEDVQADLSAAMHEPYAELATRYAQSLIAEADSVTVSNVALRRRFGGHTIRHARDEREFANTPERRAAGRSRLGIADHEFALIFIGTPRAHKGVLDVARALHEIDDPNLVFHIVGDIVEPSLNEQLRAFNRARIVCHPNCGFYELPDLLAAGDLVPLLQSEQDPISQYQIPAKVSDALGLGVPVVASPVAPLADLIAAGCVLETDSAGLANTIVELKAADAAPDTWRRHFLDEFANGINRVRLHNAIDEARSAVDNAECGLSSSLTQLVELFYSAWASQQDIVGSSAVVPSVEASDSGHDIALFWKQNDSGLFGRRSDMVARYLARSPGVRRVIQFDAPIAVSRLEQQLEAATDDQQHMLLQNLLARGLGLADEEHLVCRTCVTDDKDERGVFAGQNIVAPQHYVRWVRQQMEAVGMRPEQTIGWFCPVVPESEALIDNLGFQTVVSDLIDDQRAWDIDDRYRNTLEAAYRHTLGNSDVVFANCRPLADSMMDYAAHIHVVENGAEQLLPVAKACDTSTSRPGPVAGYVGTLRDRIDWMLLHDVVQAMPEVTFAFYGPGSDSKNAQALAVHANVHFGGIVPYRRLARTLASFDVGLIPHLDNRLTARMNPLKAYNYFAAGLPIVTTEVGNLGDFGSVMNCAKDAQQFVTAIRAAMGARPDTDQASWRTAMDGIAWEGRVEHMLVKIVDQLKHPQRYAA